MLPADRAEHGAPDETSYHSGKGEHMFSALLLALFDLIFNVLLSGLLTVIIDAIGSQTN